MFEYNLRQSCFPFQYTHYLYVTIFDMLPKNNSDLQGFAFLSVWDKWYLQS